MIEDFLRALLGIPPGATKINKDLAVMRQLTKPVADQLIPGKMKRSLELDVPQSGGENPEKGNGSMILGSVQSIYVEPMVTFAYMDYVKGTREALLYCRTRDLEIVYRIKKRDIDVFLNGNQVAIIDQQNIMYGLKSRSAVGRVKPYSADLLSIVRSG